ncbi:MAG: ABC transporter permease subunit [Opitutales bacterium]|nr:ABC transporter permease subunit [Opitutales bacterium]
MNNTSKPYKVPKRFRVTRRTLWFDNFMNYFIVVGGVAVIAAVMGIFVFIFFQVLPLFQGASVKPLAEHDLTQSVEEIVDFDLDEWAELPVVINNDGSLKYLDLVGDRGTIENNEVFNTGETTSTLNYNSLKRLLVAGSTSGKFAYAKLGYRANFDTDSIRTIHPEVTSSEWFELSENDESIQFVDYGEGDSNKMAAAICIDSEGNQHIRAITLEQKRSLFGGGGKVSIGKRFDLTPEIDKEIQKVDVSSNGDLILVIGTQGEVSLFIYEAGDLTLRQRFWPFDNLDDTRIQSADFLQGDVSVVFTSPAGHNRIFSLSLNKVEGKRLYSMTKEFEDLPEPAIDYYPGVRNKSYLLTGKNHASLRYSTTETIRWEEDFSFNISKGVIGEKYDRLALLDDQGKLHLYNLKDPHPQAGLKAFFGKIWYEGQPESDYIWQSTGGTDDFEPKLSLIPLILGSLKGTFYAMLFAVPIALLAALYTSQFLEPKLKGFVKPTMEIMASLPSVVLGFMAALWLAPLVDTHVPSFLLLVIGIPLFTFLFALGWLKLPKHIRLRIPAGMEFVLLAPFLLIVCYICWNLGPVFERTFFVVTNPETGERIADFRLWWPDFTGASYTQRNSLIVGFMMGFAVIPIIFTIAEDSMSNVPDAMRSGSLALGASRWQTAINIVLPTASAGIFSSLMIGFGRAVGETMIVVMATGNTPVKDFNIFSGMRTLSANIAVELPEAPYHGTLYRTLFLGALVLFIMTFLINTVAEVLRQKLRDRYKTVE